MRAGADACAKGAGASAGASGARTSATDAAQAGASGARASEGATGAAACAAGRPHILVVRFSAMGDVAMSVRAVEALRRTWPDVAITVATTDKLAWMYGAVPDIDFVTLRPHASLKELFSLMKRAQAMGITHVADIHNTLRGKILRLYFRLHGAKTAKLDKMRVGRAQLKRQSVSASKSVSWLRHNVLRFCDVFAKLGFPVPDPKPETRLSRPIPSVFGSKSGTWIGYSPFASKEIKIYPQDLSRELISKLSSLYDRIFIFSGPGAEQQFAQEMEQSLPNVTAVFGKIAFTSELDLIANLDLMISMDSFAMHIASIAAVPVVTIWGATHPAAGFYAYGADETSFVQRNDLPCRPCSIYGEGKCLRGDLACLRGITPDEIIARVQKIFGH